MSTPKIAIIGAGPAGCTLARLLLNASIAVTVFEGETSHDSRPQGATLDLHSDTGQKALKEAGLFHQFEKYARYDGEAMAILDKTLKAYLKMGGTGGKATSRGRPEIDRFRLRNLLLESLPPGTIRWGCRLRSVDPETLTLHFDHGAEKGFDLIVGADGAWSKIRPLLSSVKPTYAGVGGTDLVITGGEKKYPDIAKIVNRGTTFTFSDHKGVIIQQRGDGSLTMGFWSQRDENWQEHCGYDVHDSAQTKEALLKDYEDWNIIFKDAIRAADSDYLVARSLYHLPVDFRWEAKPGVTLIGDAAHLMTPFAGEGVNLALADSMTLAREIISVCKKGYTEEARDRAVRKAELQMFKRAPPMASVSRLNMADMFFNSDSPRDTIASFVRRALGDSWLIKLLLPLWFVQLLLRTIFWW